MMGDVMALTMILNLAEYYLRLVSIPEVCIDKVFIWAFGLAYEVCVEVSLLCSFPTTVCEVADSVICQVAILPSFNSL